MYGMVNQGVAAYVKKHHGDATWAQVLDKAGVGVGDFETMLAYDDDITYKLVGSACEVLGVSGTDFLEAFGDHWVDYASDTAIGRLLSFSGDTLFEVLDNLNEMHERIQLSLPHLRPPSFEFEMGDGITHRLHYYSERDGLQPMVIGLVKGLARRCDVDVVVRIVECRIDGADHDIFELDVTERQATGTQVA